MIYTHSSLSAPPALLLLLLFVAVVVVGVMLQHCFKIYVANASYCCCACNKARLHCVRLIY